MRGQTLGNGQGTLDNSLCLDMGGCESATMLVEIVLLHPIHGLSDLLHLFILGLHRLFHARGIPAEVGIVGRRDERARLAAIRLVVAVALTVSIDKN